MTFSKFKLLSVYFVINKKINITGYLINAKYNHDNKKKL